MKKITLTIDDHEVTVPQDYTILEAAKSVGIKVPHLCHLKELMPAGACRVCVVEVEGARNLVPSCTFTVSNGMQVKTASPRVLNARRLILELLLSDHPLDCMTCEKAGNCKLQDLAYDMGLKDSRFKGERHNYPVDRSNPFIVRDYNKCILCERCVRACDEIAEIQAIDYSKRGFDTKVSVPFDGVLQKSDCVFCGQCVEVCPTGALTEKKAEGMGRIWETEKVRTTCPYCGVGCQIWLHVKDGKIVKATPVKDAEPNRGRLCVKGRFGYDFMYSEERLKTPLIKQEDGQFKEATWDEALDLIATKFKEIIAKNGPDAVAGISCARSINEDSYNMQKLFRAVMGTNNIDHCARVCHAPTVAGLATSFGSGAMTNSFADFEKAKMFFVIGSNMTEAHPVAAGFVKRAVRKGAELLVIDPRRTDLAKRAKLHLPIKVGSDIALLNAFMYVLITEDLYAKEYVESCTAGFEKLKAKVLEYSPERVADICGIPAETIRAVARHMATVKPAMLIYTLGITEHTCGVNNVMSCANLQMLLGNVGFECGGVNPLRGQNNVQGACDMGAIPNVFPGYQRVDNPDAREKFKAAWGVDSLPEKTGLMMPAMFDGLLDGKIKALYVFGENLANTEPDTHHVEKCLSSAEFLVCQDIFPNETTRFAHVILPAAAWGEKEGTFANSERRVSMVRAVKEPPGEAKQDWWIFKEIARRMGHEWPSKSAQEIWDHEVAALCPSFAGIKYRRIEHDGLQWPVHHEEHFGTPTLHLGGKFTCGLGQLVPIDWTPPAEVADSEYPFVLSTGRRLYHYHTRTQTGRAQGLNDLMDKETADISFDDAAALGIADGDMVRVTSRRGEVKITAKVTDEVPKGVVWMTFHFRDTCANWLTNAVFDPISQTAEYKACAVKLEKC